MKNLKQKIKNNWTKIFSIFLFLVLLGAYSNIFAIPPATKYSPGEILNPNCDPETENCTVDISTTETDPIVGNINGLVKANGSGTISAVTSGTDIKTINGSSLLGSGNIAINPSQWITTGSDIYYNGGNVGIGTTTPTSKLYVNGSTFFVGGDGDVNNSGSSNSTDSTMVSRYFSNLLEFTEEQYSKADVTGDGNVNLFDRALITRRAIDPPFISSNLTKIKRAQSRAIYPKIPNGWDYTDWNKLEFGIGYNDSGYNAIDINGSGLVGVGVDSPTAILHLKAGTATAGTAPLKFNSGTLLGTPETGAIEFDGTHYYGTIGSTRYQLDQQDGGLLSDADYNTVGGTDAGLNLATGAQENTFLGYQAGLGGVMTNAADYNTAIGSQSLFSNTTGHDNTGVGAYAFYYNTTGYNNTATGSSALAFNTTGHDNVAVGAYNLYYNNTGNDNTSIGSLALQKNTSGIENTAIGSNSLFTNTTSSFNTAVGAYTLPISTGEDNTAIGDVVLNRNTTGSRNTGLGSLSLFYTTTGNSNTAGGFQSLYNNTTGSNNVALGIDAGHFQADGITALTDPENSIYIGPFTKGLNNADSNSIVIGYNAISNGPNTTTIGNTSTLRTYLTGLNLKAGTATAGTAPLKFNSGTLLGTPETGAIEFDGTHYYGTIGSTRYQLDQQGGGGLLSDADFNTKGGTDAGLNLVSGAQNNTFLGYQAGKGGVMTNAADNNTGIGFRSLYSNTTGYGNTANGYYSLLNNTTGYYNTANGWQSLLSNTTGWENTANGVNSLFSNTTGSQNTANGSSALASNTTGYSNTANGYASLYSNKTGSNSVAIGAESQYYANNTDTPWTNENTSVGYQSLRGSTTAANNTGVRNTAIGYQSLFSNSTGSQNTAVGYLSLLSNTTGSQNTANGFQALRFNSTGSQNTAMGYYSLGSNTTGWYNSTLGFNSLTNNTTGSNNSALGISSLTNNTTGGSNSALGANSLSNNTTGDANSSLGMFSLNSNKTGSNGVAIGYQSQYYANDTTTPWTNYNTSIGYASLRGSTTAASNTGNYNTAIGYDSLLNNSTGGSNSALGYYSLYSNTTGSSNIGLGYQAGRYVNSSTSPNEISNNSIYIGYDTQALANGDTNEIVIGHQALGHGSNTAQWGNTSMTNHYFSGSIQFSTYGAGTLTTDASGNITASSDERLKNIEGDFNNEGNALDIINSINPILYKWNDISGFDQTTIYAGFSAQNIRDLIPEAVGIDKNGYLTLSDRPILATAVNAIKELDLKVKALDEEIKGMTLGEMIKDFIENEANRFEKIFAKTVVTEGIEMKDTATGEDYCVVITNGEFEKVKGKCGEPVEDVSTDNSSDSDEGSSSDVEQEEESELGSDAGTEEETIEQTEIPTEEGSSTTDEEEASVDSPVIPSEEIPTDNTTITTTESVIEGQ